MRGNSEETLSRIELGVEKKLYTMKLLGPRVEILEGTFGGGIFEVSKSALEVSSTSKSQKNGQTETSVLLAAHVAEPGEVGEADTILKLW